MGVETKIAPDFIASIEEARKENERSHYEFKILHGYCVGVVERKVETDSEKGSELHCPVCDVSSAVE